MVNTDLNERLTWYGYATFGNPSWGSSVKSTLKRLKLRKRKRQKASTKGMFNSDKFLTCLKSRMNIPLLLEALEPLANRDDLFANQDVTLAYSLVLSGIVRGNMQHFVILVAKLLLEGPFA